MTLEEFVARVKELAQGMRPGEAKVIVEFPERWSPHAKTKIVVTRTERDQV